MQVKPDAGGECQTLGSNDAPRHSSTQSPGTADQLHGGIMPQNFEAVHQPETARTLLPPPAPPAEVLLAAMTSLPAAAMLNERFRSRLSGEVGRATDWSPAVGWHQRRNVLLEHHSAGLPLPLGAMNSLVVPGGHCHGGPSMAAGVHGVDLQVLPWIDCAPRPCMPLVAAGHLQTPATAPVPARIPPPPAHHRTVVRSF